MVISYEGGFGFSFLSFIETFNGSLQKELALKLFFFLLGLRSLSIWRGLERVRGINHHFRLKASPDTSQFALCNNVLQAC